MRCPRRMTAAGELRIIEMKKRCRQYCCLRQAENDDDLRKSRPWPPRALSDAAVNKESAAENGG